MATAKEEEEEIRSENPRTQPPMCEMGNATNIDSLPDDLLFQILVRVPAVDLYQRARLVSSRWFRTIHGDAFTSAYLRHSTPGILFVEYLDRAPAEFLSAGQGGRAEVSISTFATQTLTIAGYNGLLLRVNVNGYRIYNPVTNCEFNLPEFPGFERVDVSFGIAYAAASNEYKVAGTCRHKSNAPAAEKFFIVNVGVNSTWRDVGMERLSPRAKELLCGVPLNTVGFMHWVSSEGTDIVSFNLENECFTEARAHLPPLACQGTECRYSHPRNYLGEEKCQYYYIGSTGRCITALILCGDWCWEVWEMIGETGECKKLSNKIDLGAQKGRVEECYRQLPKPLDWVRYPDLLAFLCGPEYECCIVYNLDKHEIDSIHITGQSSYYRSILHRNSLVCFA